MMTEVSLVGAGQGHSFLARFGVNQKKSQRSAQFSEHMEARQLTCPAQFCQEQGRLYPCDFLLF